MRLDPFKQNRLGKIILSVSFFFVAVFVVLLIASWIKDPAAFHIIFGG